MHNRSVIGVLRSALVDDGVPGVIHTYDLNKNCIMHSSELIIINTKRMIEKKVRNYFVVILNV